ncbi:MAG: hypothetical protein KGY66_04350 [Candidatus Thermoplasmatota archaeon]|nr:hypothetical protein [Candidatus Thermoplasmatota archaeon]MBS3790128.1 hypothetical protein [Candidatus Thermoplasmatota archaeon]
MPIRNKFGDAHIDERRPSTLVLGIGGAGRNIVEDIGELPSSSVKIYEVGTSSRPPKLSFLSISREDMKDAYDSELEVKERPLTESEAKLKRLIKNFKIVYLIAGLGGKTGSWTVPTCAEISKSHCSLTMGLLAKPFESESKMRRELSEESQAESLKYLDMSAVFPNSRLLEINPNLPIKKAFEVMNRIIQLPILDLNSVITKRDIPQIKNFCKKIDEFKIGAAYGSGRKKGERAAKEALKSPWLGASTDFKKVFTIITTGKNEATIDAKDALDVIQRSWPEADIMWGLKEESGIKERMRVTILAGKQNKI